MRNIRLIVEYDGGGYAGWQVQPHAPTVQGALVHALERLTGERVSLVGASRTDAGVHALGQTANFRTGSALALERIRAGMNALLPADIVVREAAEAEAEFDSRRDARGKRYLYTIVNRDCRPALLRDRAWFIDRPLDIALMREAAVHFVGRHDFASFMASGSDAATTVREITSVEIDAKEDGVVEISVGGTAFLRHMVRIMAGTLADAGLGRIAPGDVAGIIEAADRRRAAKTAPARGLTLVRVEY